MVSSAVDRAYSYRSFRPLSSIHRAVEAARPDLVVPCDDLATAHLHLMAREDSYGSHVSSTTATLLRRSLGSPANYSITDSRHEFLAMARAEGLLVPNSAPAPGLPALNHWMRESGLPAVLKKDRTSGGEGVRIVKTQLQGQRAFLELASRRLTSNTMKRILVDRDRTALASLFRRGQPIVSIQQFVSGQDANVAVACWQGEVLAQVTAAVLKTRGPTGPAAVIRMIENSQTSAAVKKIVRRLGLSGFAGFDFIIEPHTGKAFLIEINPRATQTCHLQLGVGRDLPAALCAAVSESSVPTRPSITARRTIVLWPHISDDRLPSDLAQPAYFDTPSGDPEVLRLYGQNKRFTFSGAVKTLWNRRGKRKPSAPAFG